MKPFLLFLAITVSTPDGISVTTDRFYTPSKSVCLETAAQLKKDHTWEVKARVIFYEDQFVTTHKSKAVVSCIPMRGVQHMPGDR